MRILVDVSHPAHVHLFRNAIGSLRDRGHAVRVVSRRKDVTTDLLDAYGIDHTPLSRKRPGVAGVAREWVGRGARLLRVAAGFRPDVVLSRLSPTAAYVARAVGAPNVVFHDTEQAGLLDRVTTPAASVVCTPAEFGRDAGDRQIRYEGYHELAYLHPARFEPNPTRLRDAGVDPDEPFAVVRLVEWSAHHDGDAAGFSPAVVRDLVERLADRGAVYVSAEGDLPAALAEHEAPVAPDAMHDLLAFADCYVGDSGTMAAEAALLATPTVRYDPYDATLANFETFADRGLVESVDDERAAADRAVALADDPEAGGRWRRRRRRLLAQKVDVTAFAVELVEEVGGA
ncbi:DUF354 domain-containing protein (plasmid) [Halobaculum sp. CBA1158]|uniref:DUF354 domain-containing protein n=1 Tax=Halobaculum sp. CBA1158 TaxID=2904243 RepID=UPI001F22C31E|nr:DUF354 domain-containing protein [Halobaculum sp. CBA1158]UIP01529.1 DUF354 domain-containing protein [Halobaculum sp. CBA1158]